MRHLTASGEEITLASMTHTMHRSYLLASQVERPGRRRSADHSKKQRRRRRFSHSSTSCSMSCGYGGHSAITHGHAISTFPTMILTTWRQSNACLVALSMCLLVNCSKQGTDRGIVGVLPAGVFAFVPALRQHHHRGSSHGRLPSMVPPRVRVRRSSRESPLSLVPLFASPNKKQRGDEKARAAAGEELRLRKVRAELELELQDIVNNGDKMKTKKKAGVAKAVRKLLRGADHDGLGDIGDVARSLAVRSFAAAGRYDEAEPLLVALLDTTSKDADAEKC